MSSAIPWIAAQADSEYQLLEISTEDSLRVSSGQVEKHGGDAEIECGAAGSASRTRPVALLPGAGGRNASAPTPSAEELAAILREYEEIRNEDETRERRILRGRTIGMLQRYLRYSIETGRLPSVLGQEFFRAKVTTYNVVTFEDRVIFVLDMERCLERLDEFSRQLIARRILQEHDRWATARLLHCNEKTVRRLTPYALDRLADVLVKMGLLKAIDENSCQGGFASEISVSDCDDGKNNF